MRQGKIVRNAIKEHKDLAIYKIAYSVSMEIFELSKKFPDDEKFSITSQIRRSSRTGKRQSSVDLGEKDALVAAFIAKLNDSEAEAAETQTWINYAVDCGYINPDLGREFYARYNQILSGLVNMINNPSPWLITRK